MIAKAWSPTGRRLFAEVEAPCSQSPFQQATDHAFAWLVWGSGIGVMLAVLILFPRCNDLLAPLTYGRLVPLHTNAMLYGWCALPLVALLLDRFVPESPSSFQQSLSIPIWSLALAGGCLSWAAGSTTAKPFMEWTGAALWLFVFALTFLWWNLVHAVWHNRKSQPRTALEIGFLVALALVPILFAWAAQPRVYPAINPDSGGATGTSLLASTAGVIVILLAMPRLLRIARRPIANSAWLLLISTTILIIAMEHGDVSNHNLLQQLGLGTLILWPPILWSDLRHHAWGREGRRWLVAAMVWFAVLVIDGLITFMPNVLSQWKFTHAMVGHAHAAMAGFWSAIAVVILCQKDPRARRFADSKWVLWCWNGATAFHVLSLVVLGTLEANAEFDIYSSAGWTQVGLTVRLLAGVSMFAVSLWWFKCRAKPHEVRTCDP